MTLEQRSQKFQEWLPVLLPCHTGNFALVHKEDVSVYPSLEAANVAGRTLYGIDEFLVMKIQPQNQPSVA